MKLTKHINVLIPDGESDLALYIVRCLHQDKKIKIHILSSLKWVECRFSKHIASFSILPEIENDLAWIKYVADYIQKNNIDVLMPVFVKRIRIISKHKELFKDITKLVIPEIASFEIANNKRELDLFLEKNKMSKPRSYEISTKNKLIFPLIYKPVDQLGGRGVRKINSLAEWEEIIKLNHDPDKYIVQNYIKGYDIDMSVLCDKGKIIVFTMQKPFLYSESFYQPSMGIEFIYEEKIYLIVKKLMRKLNWSGVAHVDLRYDESKKEFKIIEINPRYWGSVEASKKMGVNFPYLHCLTSMELNYSIPKYKHKKFAKSRGLIKILKLNFGLKKSKYKIPEYHSLTGDLFDPLPKTYKYTIKALKKVFPKNSKFLNNFKYEVY